jgi:hypothetical protein
MSTGSSGQGGFTIERFTSGMSVKGEITVIKKLIASVLVATFMNFMIAPGFASAEAGWNLGGLDVGPTKKSLLITAGAIVAAVALVYLVVKITGGKTKKEGEQNPEEHKPYDTNPGIENLPPKSENDGAETMHVAKSGELIVTQSGELVLLTW